MKFSVLLPVAVLVSAVAAAPQPGITAAPVMRRQDDQDIGDKASDAITNAGSALGEKAGDAKTAIEGAVSDGSTWINGAWEEIKTAGVVTAAEAIVTDGVDKLNDFGTNVATGAQSLGTGLKEAGDTLVDGFKAFGGGNGASPRAVMPTVLAGAAGVVIGVAALVF